jgi:hypothetical protein
MERKKWVPVKLELVRSQSVSSIESISGNKDEELEKDNEEDVNVQQNRPLFRAHSVASALAMAHGKPPKRSMGKSGGGLRARVPPIGIPSSLSASGSRQLNQQSGKSKLANRMNSTAAEAASGFGSDQQVAGPSADEIWTMIHTEKQLAKWKRGRNVV